MLLRKAPVYWLVKHGTGSVLSQAVLSLKVPPDPQRQPQGSDSHQGAEDWNLRGQCWKGPERMAGSSGSLCQWGN